MRIETARLIGEPISAAHRSFILHLHTDPQVTATLGGPRSEEQVDQFIAQCEEEWRALGYGQWVFCEKATNTAIGRCGLRPYSLEGEFVRELLYAVDADAWGKGYATEMAEATIAFAKARGPVSDIIALTLPTNKASQRVMEKVGMLYARNVIHAGLEHVVYRIGGD